MKRTFENDLAFNMQNELRKQGSILPNFIKAAECLHGALEIFEETGLKARANDVLNILLKMAKEDVNLVDVEQSSSFDNEYQEWLKKTRKPQKLSKENVDPDLAGLLDVESFDIDASDDKLMNMEIKEDSLEVFDKTIPFEDLDDFEDENNN